MYLKYNFIKINELKYLYSYNKQKNIIGIQFFIAVSFYSFVKKMT